MNCGALLGLNGRLHHGGLMLLVCGVYGNVIRFLHPLTIEDTVFNEGLDILQSAILAAKA